MTTPQRIYRGSCLCGAVTFQVIRLQPKMAHCHCSMCRKFHGAAFATFGQAAAGDFQWLTGSDKIQSYTAPNKTTRRFCGTCGSSLTFTPPSGNDQFVEFTLGTLDSDIPLAPDAHIYVGSKANWVEISDSLPRYIEGRDSELLK